MKLLFIRVMYLCTICWYAPQPDSPRQSVTSTAADENSNSGINYNSNNLIDSNSNFPKFLAAKLSTSICH